MSSVVAAQTGPSWMPQLTAEVSPFYRFVALRRMSVVAMSCTISLQIQVKPYPKRDLTMVSASSCVAR
jgi:hypothetical protein